MNLISHAIPFLQKMAKKYKEDNDNLEGLVDIISTFLIDAQKFTIPSPNSLNVTITNSSIPFIKMPYPIMAIEYLLSVEKTGTTNMLDPNFPVRNCSKRIVLAFDSSKIDTSVFLQGEKIKKGIVSISIFYVDETKEWEIAPGAIWYDPETEFTELLISDSKYHLSGTAKLFKYEFLYNTYTQIIQQFGKATDKHPIIYNMVFNDNVEELCSLIKIVALLNAKNINTIDINPSPKLNKKRIKSGSLPFYSYKTLDIFLSKETRKIRAKNIKNHLSNFIATKRLHSVRGHFKIRKTGIYWWSSYQRGSMQKGIVEKDYNMK
jgi:hypothetical protein